MNNAMPANRRVPIKDVLGVEIGEVISAEFDEKTQEITFVGQIDNGMRFKATQPVGISFGPGDFVVIDKKKSGEGNVEHS